MGAIFLPSGATYTFQGETGKVSDGYHTYDELYAHRIELYITVCRLLQLMGEEVWRSRKHSDGEVCFDGSWFVMGIHSAKGKQLSYHLPLARWEDTNFCKTLDTAPDFDGHTAADVLERLKSFMI